MIHDPKRPKALAWLPYLATLGYVALATVIRVALNETLGTRGPWIFFFPALVLAAWQFGLGPGLLALLASAVAGTCLFVPSVGAFHTLDPTDAAIIASFVLSGSCIVAFGTVSHRNRLRFEGEASRREVAQRELGQSLQTLKSVFDNAWGDALILTDAERRVLAWNPGAAAIFGHTEAEMKGRPIDILFPVEARESGALDAAIAQTDREGQTESEGWYERRDGTRFWGTGRLSALREDDGTGLRGFVKILRDETARRNLDEAMQGQKQELERRVAERTAELEGFTYSVSHDMRAPLRAIAGNASILVEDYAEVVPPDAASHLHRIRAAANKMGALIEDLLTYARLGNQAPKAIPTDLAAIFRDVAEEERGEADVAFVSPERLVAACDPGLIRMVLQNLVGNAIKYRKPAGTTRIELGRDENGTIFVRDDGIGFDMQYVLKLFVPFERLHRDTEYPGTGIGLANVKRIVERHGGAVGAFGELGKGATFWLTLPETRDSTNSVESLPA